MHRLTDRARRFFGDYAGDLSADDVSRLLTRDTADAYRYFARGIDQDALRRLPPLKRWTTHARLVFLAFAMRLSPPRRVLYAVALVAALLGIFGLFRGFGPRSLPFAGVPIFNVEVPAPTWVPGTLWLVSSLILLNLLILLEVADRLSLKGDLEVARDIQLAMLPAGTWSTPAVSSCGLTRPANTVGGDFYDILPLADGRLAIAVGDVAGKGSPAALLMALLLAILRTLVDEGLAPPDLAHRLNAQVARHAPPSRFITLFLGVFDPGSGRLTYVNAGHLPPIVRRAATGASVRLPATGVALGMFENSRYLSQEVTLEAGDLLVLYSDGITEAENPQGEPFDESGLERVLSTLATDDLAAAGRAVFAAVERHAEDTRLADDLTVLLLKRSAQSPQVSV
ncbi:MAG TPA: PP2C family protein-serine/threonine phosphatase [Vicinamibacterales bacterium]|nr:PP2C family protein-serine/threonine phosphatase [Vicinamibacterales bacterium]